MEASALIRRARNDAGLTQRQLAARLGISQAALAQLERAGSNPTVKTLDRVLRAAGRRLDVRLGRIAHTVDETLLRETLKQTPAERIAAAERLLAGVAPLAGSARRGHG
jgi:transcriptional regulator with XRE-family HTH domain